MLASGARSCSSRHRESKRAVAKWADMPDDQGGEARRRAVGGRDPAVGRGTRRCIEVEKALAK